MSPHPGEFLRAELGERGMTQSELARRMGVSIQVVNYICRGRRKLSAKHAVALEAVLGSDARTWLTLQMLFDLDLARAKRKATP